VGKKPIDTQTAFLFEDLQEYNQNLPPRRRDQWNCTPQQDEFARKVAIEGKTKTQALKEAYHYTTNNLNTLYSEACKISKLPNVTQRIKYLKAQRDSTAVMDRGETLKVLSEIARLPIDNPKNLSAKKGAAIAMGEYHKIFEMVAPSAEATVKQDSGGVITISLKSPPPASHAKKEREENE
jgi:hypothetical protein